MKALGYYNSSAGQVSYFESVEKANAAVGAAPVKLRNGDEKTIGFLLGLLSDDYESKDYNGKYIYNSGTSMFEYEQ